MDSKNFTIGILSTTAAILLVGVLIIHSRPAPVLASGVTATAGDYVLTVGSFTLGDEEFVYVIDAPEQKMIMYRFDVARGSIEVCDHKDLATVRENAAAAGQQAGQKSNAAKKRGRRRP
jgi:hypothetical protein